ncbi:amino acid adenylation domain-containing protein, partial [Clostridium estertheticum]
ATYGATTYMTLLSAYNILLSRYSGQEDIIVGSPIAGRSHADLQGIVGIFVNTLAMRNYPKGEKTFEKFLQDVKGNALSAYENQEYQFDNLVEELDIKRDLSRSALFDTMFVLQNIDIKELEIDNLKFKQYEFENKISKFDFTLSAIEIGEEIVFNMEYCTKLYKRETIERMIEHFVNILKAVAADTKIKLSEIELITEEEKHKLLYEFNDTKADYPREKTIHELFEEQVEKSPESIAVVYEGKKLTYKELNEKSNRVARILREKGVKADSIVGIMVERSLEMMIGIIGILKAGGAYLPIDPSHPKERIEYMLSDSECKVLLSKKKSVDHIEFDGEVIDLFDEDSFKGNSSNLEKINKSSNLAYIIYTSGTTGEPKGIMIEHFNLNNFLHSLTKKYDKGFNSSDRILSLTNYVFDVSACEFFVSLINGSTLVINYKQKTFDPVEIAKLIVDNQITYTYIPPSLLLKVYENLKPYKDKVMLRKLLVGVEAIRGEILNKFYTLNKDLEIVNGYGPSESTICSTFYKVTKSEPQNKNVSIGRNVGNTNIYILDKYLKIVSVGIAGKIFISGDGLSRGYINKPELTAGKFIENPFKLGVKMYNTGDLARWMPDGNIEFIGRIDHQVKIRGFRIELGEIENQLLNHEAIKEIIVLDRKDENDAKYLCAYIVSEKELTVGELRSYLSKKLPDYMIPTYFMQIEKMPLTPNGKLDRKALPEIDGKINTGVEYVAPRNKIEEKLIKVWAEVLGVERIGIDDDFFTLGGDSIKAIQVCARLGRYNLKITVSELFANPTIRESSINTKQKDKQINQTVIEGKVELTAIQRWFFERKFINMHHWNQSFMMYSKEGFDEKVIEKVFSKI